MQWVAAVHMDKQILKRTGQGHHRCAQTGYTIRGLVKYLPCRNEGLGVLFPAHLRSQVWSTR